MEELKKSYQFIVESGSGGYNHGATAAAETTTWQDRMVINYHQHLYKTYVIADLSRYKESQIGLRWRMKAEVDEEKGVESCGNKHCPCYFDQDRKRSVREIRDWRRNVNENELVEKYIRQIRTTTYGDTEHAEDKRIHGLPYGVGLSDYEVHFAYVEKGQDKEELVKLRLCLRCAPKLFFGKEGSLGARRARDKNKSSWTKEYNCLDESTERKSCETIEPTLDENTNQNKKRYNHNNRSIRNMPIAKKKRQDNVA